MENLIGTVLGGCRIDAEIGHGGMGTVYKAHHMALDIPVAVKILKPLSEMHEAEERFLREARIAAKLRHPNIVGVHNVGIENGLHFIVMDYIEGKNLLELIKEKGKFEPHEAVKIGIEVLEALQAALENGIVHRDIKPENILMEKGVAKLADLGLARIAGDSSLTQSSTVLGSPHYVAPEQAENPSAADCRSDIYSLGCTLYHMLAAKAPYEGSTPVEVILRHIKQPVPVLNTENQTIPAALSRVISVMMDKDPASRYKTPAEAISALKATLAESTGPASKPLISGNSPKKPLWISAAVILLIAILAVFFGIIRPMFADKEPPVVQSIEDSTKVVDTIQKASTDTVPQVKKKSPQVVKKKTAPVQVVKTNGTDVKSPLLTAVKIGDSEAIKKLLDEGVSPNATAGASTTPLHEAVRRGMTSDAELLLARKANPNVRDKRGDTPLHYALRENASFMVKILLKGGADPNMADHNGKTPLKIASSVDSELEKMIKGYGGK